MKNILLILFLFPFLTQCQKIAIKKGARPIHLVNAGEAPPAPPFTPTDLGSNLIRWYDVTNSDAIVLNTGRVDSLRDLGPLNYDVGQTFNTKPAYSATGGSNNQPYMTVDSLHSIYDNINGYSGSGTIAYAVVRVKDLATNPVGGQYSKSIISYFQNTAGLCWDSTSGVGGTVTIKGAGITNSPNYKYAAHTSWQIISFEMGPDTTLLGSNNIPIPIRCHNDIVGAGPTQLNFGYNSNTKQNEVSELIICDYSITQAQRDSVYAYLNRKYMPSEQPYFATWGNSLTAGDCNYVTNWVYQVQDSLDMPLVNMATGGTIVQPNLTATGVAGRNFIDVYPLGIGAQKPVWMVVMFGVNDGNQGGIDATWKVKYKAILQSFINDGYNPDSIILCIPPCHSTRVSIMAQANTYIGEIASELSLRLFDAKTLFDANGGDSNWDVGDVLHPNVAGNILFRNGLIAVINL